MTIGGAHHRRRLGERRIDVAGVHQQRVARRLLADVLVGAALRGERRAGRPRHLEFRRRLHRLPGLLGDDADEVALGDHLDHTRHAADGRAVHSCHCRADARRPDHAAVQHARHLHGVDELGVAGHQTRQIHSRHRKSQDLPRAGMLALRRRVERQVEAAPAEQLRVCELPGRVGAHHAVVGSQKVSWNIQTLGRHPYQRLARGGCGQSQVGLVEVGGV